jgi:hypothetical protein
MKVLDRENLKRIFIELREGEALIEKGLSMT